MAPASEASAFSQRRLHLQSLPHDDRDERALWLQELREQVQELVRAASSLEQPLQPPESLPQLQEWPLCFRSFQSRSLDCRVCLSLRRCSGVSLRTQEQPLERAQLENPRRVPFRFFIEFWHMVLSDVCC